MDNAEMTKALDELIEAAKRTADVLMCAYNTVKLEMLERGAPRELADEAAMAQTSRLLREMMGQVSNNE